MDPDEEQSAAAGAGSGDRCSSCGQSLASDQRYCINCGQRRGKPRFSFSELTGKKEAPPAPKPKPKRQRLSQGLAFIAGVATLLLALGVGVLIGHNSNGNSKLQAASAPQQQVIKLEGGGAGTSSGGAGNGAPTAATHTNQTPTTPGLPVTHIVLTKKQVQAVRKAETNVLGQGAQNLAPPTVQPGSPCAHGAGCQGGKFTGNFFSGGQN